jgi:hypothetical protein
MHDTLLYDKSSFARITAVFTSKVVDVDSFI